MTLIAISLLGAFYLIFTTIEAERAEREQVRMTNQILLELRNIQRAALRAETGQRGYLITLDRKYLDPYRQGSAEMRPAIDRLQRLLAPVATERQSQLMATIEKQAEAKLAELEGTVELLEDGELLEARRQVLSDEGQEAMAALKASIGEMENIEQVILEDQAQATAAAEARLFPLLGLLLFLVLVFIIFSVRLVARTASAEAEAAQASALAEAHDRADLLAKELNHRVKNLFAVILAIVQMSGRDKPEAKPVVDSIATRIRALLTAHEVTQGALDRPVASIHALVETTLSPYRSNSQPAEVSGPEFLLPAKSVTPLGLVLHELTTNAVKYGAWANGGTVIVTWQVEGAAITIEWRETGVDDCPEPDREGFGSMLMTSASRQLGGSIERRFGPGGCTVTITIPVEVASDELESPRQAP
ncbi:CHASE3 domain-containing protein [Altererythrobacter arenosus]|uniref:histidine kinase n=1 Tax=Altererythrobacter arenosus TaxID=3032592 RepID=A0ABY8FV91_9SPHN|nr:CHASE3 domain-containing protein [Altererythrobacter sp. CAU 1644]WFL78908.1 CHASE3 domain-containing protein [Altererythrobacter sp. CAU 1644]